MKVKLSQLTTSQKFKLLRLQLRKDCLDRELQIDALLALLLCQQHGLLLGPPGTGKSMLIELLCKAISLEYWSILMSHNTKPEEVFGPLSISALKEAEIYKRNISGMLPEAEVAYLDEVFKSNSTILNSLLGIVNERKFYNPRETKVPLRSMVGSSNELPEIGSPLEALVDRFTYKSWIGYLGEEDSKTLWKRSLNGYKSQVSIRLDRQSILQAGAEAKNVSISAGILNVIVQCKTELANVGHIVSDRKWLKILEFLKAVAWVRGESSVSLQVIQQFLPDCIWRDPEQQDHVCSVIDSICVDVANQAEEISSEAEIIFTDRPNFDSFISGSGTEEGKRSAFSDKVLDWISKVETLQQRIKESKTLVVDPLNSDLLNTLELRCEEKIEAAKQEINSLLDGSLILEQKYRQIEDSLETLLLSPDPFIDWSEKAGEKVTQVTEEIENLKLSHRQGEIDRKTFNRLDAILQGCVQKVYQEIEARYSQEVK